MMAWKSGCKGITIYRDGSKDVQILSVGTTDKIQTTSGSQIIQSKIKTETLKERGERLRVKPAGKHLEICPECGGKLAIEEGCAKCYGCGFSVCQG